jgi:hypothetical protein
MALAKWELAKFLGTSLLTNRDLVSRHEFFETEHCGEWSLEIGKSLGTGHLVRGSTAAPSSA